MGAFRRRLMMGYGLAAVAVVPSARSLTYSGNAQALVDAGIAIGGTLVYSLTSGSGFGTSIPTGIDAGSYTVYYKVIGDNTHTDSEEQSITVSIGKASGSVSSKPTAKSLTYNGSGQALANAGSGTGTMYYRLGSSGSFSTTIPSQTNAGSWTLYYYAAASTNYNQSATGSITVSIGKASGSVSSKPTAKSLTYNGSGQTLANAGSGTGTMYYRLGTSGSFSTTIPSQTNAGSWTLYYYAAASTNYNQSATGSITVSIGKANRSMSWSSKPNVNWKSTATATATRSGDGTITYSSSNTGIATINSSGVITGVSPGSCTIYASVSATTNYNAASISYTCSVTEPSYNGYTYVDLGLSVKWAKCNVGATVETGYGNYYAWSSDVATKNMGGSWHMPTKDQFDELVSKTTQSWTTINGVQGMKFTASNGRYIFLPAAGSNGGSGSGTEGRYWGITKINNNPEYSRMKVLSSGASVGENGPSYKYSVRGVF